MPANMLVNQYSTENLFLGEKFIEYVTLTNGSGSTMTLVPGRLMGQVLADGKWLPQVSSATDGSELPRAVCADSYSIANGATATIAICRKGEINENKVTFGGSDTWATAVRTVSTGGGTVRSLLIANSGLMLVGTTELSGQDNS